MNNWVIVANLTPFVKYCIHMIYRTKTINKIVTNLQFKNIKIFLQLWIYRFLYEFFHLIFLSFTTASKIFHLSLVAISSKYPLKAIIKYLLCTFLAHLTWKVKWAFLITWPPSSIVCCRRRLLTSFTNIFSPETTWPNLTKLGHNHN